MGSSAVRPPQQERSKRTLDRLLAAAREVVATEGFEQASITDITARAGVAVGTFYTRFDNKEALLHALHEQQTTLSREALHQGLHPSRFAGRTIRFILTEVVDQSFEITRSIAGFQRACYQRALSDPVFAARELGVRRDLATLLHELLTNAADDIGHRDPDQAVAFCTELFVSVITEHVNAESFTASMLSDEQVGQELVHAMCAYLQTRPRPTSNT